MRILCFGDSNTYGYDPRDYFVGRYGPEDRWPELLAAQTGWDVINAGLNGRIIPLHPYPLRLLKDYGEVDRMLIMLGTNNLLQGASAGEAATRMENLITQLQPHYRSLLLVAPPPMVRGAWVPTDELVAESIRLIAQYRALAERLNIPFADTLDWEIEMAFDGVHFTEAGNHSFAENIRTYLP